MCVCENSKKKKKKKNFFFFEIGNFFSKREKSHLNPIGKGAEFRPLRTQKKSLKACRDRYNIKGLLISRCVFISQLLDFLRVPTKKHAYAGLPPSENHASQGKNVRTNTRNSAFPRALLIHLWVDSRIP